VKGIVFYKMTGSGNDFVLLDGRTTTLADWPAARIVDVCDRRLGVGADGLVILTPEAAGAVRMDFFNCDGSRAAMCGNAALCSTRLSAYLEMAPASGMRLVTGAGIFPTRCRTEPDLAELNLPDFPAPELVGSIRAAAGEGPSSFATVGVPHLVVPVEDIERADLMVRGRELRNHSAIAPAGANVNFVASPAGKAGIWPVRTYERGVEGETLACGTGAVAVAAALAQAGRASLPLEIRTRSGRCLRIAANLENGSVRAVWLAGEGRMVFTGVL
jgi:diaminopimelate epimerase